MEYYGNALCVSYDDLVGGGIMTASNLQKMAQRGKLTVVRTAGGKGNCALVAVDSLPEKYKAEVRKLYPEGNRTRLIAWVQKNYERDTAAYSFFFNKENTGVELPQEKVLEYTINASVLNCCIRLYDRAAMCQKMFGNRYNWDEMTAVIDTLRDLYHHTLPASTMRFRKKVAEYKRDGYICLVSGKFGNQSARKVDFKTERLILGIAILPNKPFNTSVAEMYNQFVCGELDVWDPETGEMFNPDDFTDKNGEPMALSETTINNYLNSPKNRVLIDNAQMSFTTFMHEVMPHVHRHAPEFSFSKISFDDRDLPRKLKDSKQRPKAYYAYDVTSQCVVGYAYNRNKNTDLVVDCFRSLFMLIEREGWGCPAQVEVENHLMSQWRDSFLKAGVMFPFVRFCAPQNSQEKYAEQMNGAKKKSYGNPNDPARFVRKVSVTENGEAADQTQYSLNEERIAEEKMYDGYYAVCTNLVDDSVKDILSVSERRWEIEESFRILKTDFKSRPVYLSREDRIKAHFLVCYLSLLIYRLLEKKLNYKYTCSQIITTLRSMKLLAVEGIGYQPAYKRTEITDDLHNAFGFRTDYQIMKKSSVRSVIRQTKERSQ